MKQNKRLNYEKYPVCGVPCPANTECGKCRNLHYSKFRKAFEKQLEVKA